MWIKNQADNKLINIESGNMIIKRNRDIFFNETKIGSYESDYQAYLVFSKLVKTIQVRAKHEIIKMPFEKGGFDDGEKTE